MEDALSHSGSLSLSLCFSGVLLRHVLCCWSLSSSLRNKKCIHVCVSALSTTNVNPPLTANWHFRSASFLLVTPQLPIIQSILEGWNQVPPSHLRYRFTRIYVAVEKKRQSQLPFRADCKVQKILFAFIIFHPNLKRLLPSKMLGLLWCNQFDWLGHEHDILNHAPPTVSVHVWMNRLLYYIQSIRIRKNKPCPLIFSFNIQFLSEVM